MKVTLKEFLQEQASLGIDVPKIFEDMSVGPYGRINDDTSDPDFEDWDNTDISGPAIEGSISNLMDDTIDLIKKEVIERFGNPNIELEKKLAKMIGNFWIEKIKTEFFELNKFNEGFFGDLKNKFSGTIEFNAANVYQGTPESQKFVTNDRRSKVQIDTLIKKGMTPEEAKAAVMYVFDKAKGPLGFVSKKTEYDPQTKTLKVSSVGGMNPSLGSL